MSEKPRLLVLNQYYWPGVEATAHLLTELCEALADDFDVTVVTGALHGARGGPRGARNGVEIVRVALDLVRPQPSSRCARSTTSPTSAGRSRAGSRAERPDVVLCMTDPPMIGDVALPSRAASARRSSSSARTSSPRSPSS